MSRRVNYLVGIALSLAVPQVAAAVNDGVSRRAGRGDEDVITCEQTFGCVSGQLRCAQFYWQGFTVTCFGPPPESPK